MHIVITANKGGAGCSTLASFLGIFLPNRVMYTNDRFPVPDSSIKKLSTIEEFNAIQFDDELDYIFDINRLGNEAFAKAIEKKADLTIIPCREDKQSMIAALRLYQNMARRCKHRLIVINGYSNRDVRIEVLQYFVNHNIPAERIVALRFSKIAYRLLAFGSEWRSSIRDRKGLHRLDRTLEIYEDILTTAITDIRRRHAKTKNK